jgi:hypothetical protein
MRSLEPGSASCLLLPLASSSGLPAADRAHQLVIGHVGMAAIRFTSYSNGSGRVSSKSFRSNRVVRSGEADTPESVGGHHHLAYLRSVAASPAGPAPITTISLRLFTQNRQKA